MRIGVCQISSTPEPERNLELVRDAVRRAADDGARVALLPEATMACFGISLRPLAEPLDGPWAKAVREIADEHGLVVVAGMFTPSPDGRVRNTMLVTGRGEHRGYDKIHLYDAFGFTESKTVAPGSEPMTLTVDDVTLGIATCYDVRFPELFRRLADEGASIILLGASWQSGPGKRDQWELLVRARALDSTSWVVASATADQVAAGMEPIGKVPFGIGYSMVADPYGRIHTQLGPEPDVLVLDVDHKAVDEARRAIPVLANRKL